MRSRFTRHTRTTPAIRTIVVSGSTSCTLPSGIAEAGNNDAKWFPAVDATAAPEEQQRQSMFAIFADLKAARPVTTFTKLLVELAAAPDRTLTIQGESRFHDAGLLRDFGYVKILSSGLDSMTVKATKAGKRFAEAITRAN